VGELETHYKRLCRVNDENLWKKGFGLLAVVLMGGVVGAALAGPGWTWEVKAAAALTLLAGLGWKGIAETESEGLQAIRDDYKEDILDSLVLEPVDGRSGRQAVASPSQEGALDEEKLNREIEEIIESLKEIED
jgi:hypothetical protein